MVRCEQKHRCRVLLRCWVTPMTINHRDGVWACVPLYQGVSRGSVGKDWVALGRIFVRLSQWDSHVTAAKLLGRVQEVVTKLKQRVQGLPPRLWGGVLAPPEWLGWTPPMECPSLLSWGLPCPCTHPHLQLPCLGAAGTSLRYF